MIITISGALGSGKSTVAKILAKKLNLAHYSTGDFMRDIARKRGITPIELSKIAEKDPEIDKILDERQKKLGEEEDNFVIDARLGFYFIPRSIKIFLDVDIEEAGERIFRQKREDEDYNKTKEMTLEMLKKRLESEKRRYKEYYDIDYYDPGHYDILIDTTSLTPEQVAERLTKAIDALGSEN